MNSCLAYLMVLCCAVGHLRLYISCTTASRSPRVRGIPSLLPASVTDPGPTNVILCDSPEWPMIS